MSVPASSGVAWPGWVGAVVDDDDEGDCGWSFRAGGRRTPCCVPSPLLSPARSLRIPCTGRTHLTCLLPAPLRMICDDTYSNKSWSVVAQSMFPLKEINQMEREVRPVPTLDSSFFSSARALSRLCSLSFLCSHVVSFFFLRHDHAPLHLALQMLGYLEWKVDVGPEELASLEVRRFARSLSGLRLIPFV